MAAVSAVAVWLLAVVLLSGVPAEVREAHLYRLRTNEGLGWLAVGYQLFGGALLLAGAHALSAVAHGSGLTAPRTVRTTRVLTWVGFAALGIATFAVFSSAGPDCFRSCAPFPN